MQQYKIHERNIGINLTLLYPQLHPNTSRAECECSDDYEGPSCQLDKSSIPPSVNPPSPAPPSPPARHLTAGSSPAASAAPSHQRQEYSVRPMAYSGH